MPDMSIYGFSEGRLLQGFTLRNDKHARNDKLARNDGYSL